VDFVCVGLGKGKRRYVLRPELFIPAKSINFRFALAHLAARGSGGGASPELRNKTSVPGM
jgi:hypothetical protein